MNTPRKGRATRAGKNMTADETGVTLTTRRCKTRDAIHTQHVPRQRDGQRGITILGVPQKTTAQIQMTLVGGYLEEDGSGDPGAMLLGR